MKIILVDQEQKCIKMHLVGKREDGEGEQEYQERMVTKSAIKYALIIEETDIQVPTEAIERWRWNDQTDEIEILPLENEYRIVQEYLRNLNPGEKRNMGGYYPQLHIALNELDAGYLLEVYKAIDEDIQMPSNVKTNLLQSLNDGGFEIN